MLLADLATQVKRRFGDGIGAVITDSDIFAWVNEAQIEISKETDINFIEQTSTITAYLAGSPVGIHLSNHIMIKYIKLDERFLDLKDYKLFSPGYYKMDYVGLPQYYYFVDGGQDANDPNRVSDPLVKLFPNPDTSMGTMALSIGLISMPTNVTALANPIDLPPRYHPAVMDFCLMRANERNKDWQAMKVAQEQFQLGLASRIHESSQIETSWHVQEDVLGYW